MVLRLRQGLASFRWELQHWGFEAGRQFQDGQVSGPMRSWLHTHAFLPREGGGTVLEDEIAFEPPLGLPVPSTLIKGELDRLFAFRYRRLKQDLDRHAAYVGEPRLTVAVSGASGLVGTALTHFLTTGGNRVVPMVRRRSSAGRDRWTEERKKQIRESRVQGTQLLTQTLESLGSGGLRVLFSASAVGYYGNRGEERLDEGASAGKGFIAEVVRAWEGATEPATRAGVRVVRLRTGVVISPAGGALGQMLLPFKMGVGGRLGSGRQYLSWVDLDDLTDIILHALYDSRMEGPVNATAPYPVTNAAFGQLGEEALLWGQRVIPARLERAGFRFAFEGVEESLRFQLGRQG